MKNPATGKFEVYRFIKSTGATIIGHGSNNEEAKADLKAQLAAYREKPLVETHHSYSSPGFEYRQTKNGHITYRFNADRKQHILVRPDLLKFVNDMTRRAKVKG